MKERSSRKTYWASWDGEDLARKLDAIGERFKNGQWSPLYDAWVKNTYLYYSSVLDSQSWMTSLNFGGEQGELVRMQCPEARKAVRDRVAVVTKQRLAFNCIAMTQGSDVTEEMRIANALAENLVANERLDTKQSLLCEQGAVVGTAFISARWRSDKGSPRIVEKAAPQDDHGAAAAESDEGRVLYDGDVEVAVHHLDDVLFDYRQPDWDAVDHVRLRVRRNRWTLVAQHPELADEIVKLPSVEDAMGVQPQMSLLDDDTVYVYEWYHRPRPGLDQGRLFVYANAKTIFYDDVNPYKTIPIERYMPEPIFGLGYGYPQLSNLLPAQEMLDHEMSCIASNHSALGVQNVAVPRGADMEVQQLYGLNLYNFTAVPNVPGGGMPQPMQLTASSPESFKFGDILSRKIQTLGGINDAMRGEVSPSASGVMVATLTANALEFMNSDSKELQMVMEKTAMHAIRGYRAFAKVPRLVRLTGKNYQTFTRQFTGDQLAPIQSLKLQTANPLMQTAGGRVEIAKDALKTGLVKSMQDYVSILDGEPLSALYDADLSQNDLIASENEQLTAGEQVFTLYIDNHPLHIFKHRCLLNDPNIRKNAPRVKAILAHIEEHEKLAQTVSPVLQAMANTGQMPEGASQPPPGPPQAPPLPEGGGGDEQGGAAAPSAMGESAGLAEQHAGEDAGPASRPQPEAQPARPARDLLQRGA